jgi:hypothetical protein
MLNEILAIDTLLFSRACPLDFVLTRALLDFPLTPPSSTLDDLALTFQAAPDTAPDHRSYILVGLYSTKF